MTKWVYWFNVWIIIIWFWAIQITQGSDRNTKWGDNKRFKKNNYICLTENKQCYRFSYFRIFWNSTPYRAWLGETAQCQTASCQWVIPPIQQTRWTWPATAWDSSGSTTSSMWWLTLPWALVRGRNDAVWSMTWPSWTWFLHSYSSWHGTEHPGTDHSPQEVSPAWCQVSVWNWSISTLQRGSKNANLGAEQMSTTLSSTWLWRTASCLLSPCRWKQLGGSHCR